MKQTYQHEGQQGTEQCGYIEKKHQKKSKKIERNPYIVNTV